MKELKNRIKKQLGYGIVMVNSPFSAYWGEWIRTNSGADVIEWHPISESELSSVRGDYEFS